MNNSQLSLFDPEQDIRIIEFRESITPDLYVPDLITDWDSIETTIVKLDQALDRLQYLLDQGVYHDVDHVVDWLVSTPNSLELVWLLMALPPTLVFTDGRSIPRKLSKNSSMKTLLEIADLLNEMGFWRLVAPPIKLDGLVRTSLVAQDARTRRFRILENTNRRIRSILTQACEEASRRLDVPVTLLSHTQSFHVELRRKVEYVIEVSDTPIVAINTVIQTSSGGRQQRDLRLTYPALQQDLDEIPLKLILIADGQGVAEAPGDVLKDLFMSVYSVLSIKQLEQGMLTEVLVSAYFDPGKVTAPVARIIESVLMSGKTVTAHSLPISYDNARIALASYLDDHSELALFLSAGGESLAWSRSDYVNRAIFLRKKFDEYQAIDLLCSLLEVGSLSNTVQDETGCVYRTVSVGDALPFLPERMLVVGSREQISESLVRKVAGEAVRNNVKFAVLVTPTIEGRESQIQHLQNTLARNVILVPIQVLVRWTMDRQKPFEMFSSVILEQSDLAKISPFVMQGRTPERMYFGRAIEEATVISTLASNSVAITGSRRTGKTSLLYRVTDQLNLADHSAVFLDCHTVRNWEDFRNLVEQEWKVDLPTEFRPTYLFELVDQLRTRTKKSLVILLDEVDQLLEWDMSCSDTTASEAFFRACRSVSQSGRAQFVFSGERKIATRLWDPQSPHWNFCRSVPLQQLDRESTEKLVLQPLNSLRISIMDPVPFSDLIWKYTSGHPQIAQFLGDRLIRRLNLRVPEKRTHLASDDLDAVTNTFEFKQHYIETYWGQATELEKMITYLILDGISKPFQIVHEVQSHSIRNAQWAVSNSLRMLELYGIVRQSDDGFQLRAEWLVTALTSFSTLSELISNSWNRLNE